MLSEEIISINRMKLFTRSNDLSVVTAKDMNIVINLVENLQKEIECDNLILKRLIKIKDRQSKEIEELKEKKQNIEKFTK